MLGCEEKTLGRELPPIKFFSKKATERLFNYVATYMASKMPYAVEFYKFALASSF